MKVLTAGWISVFIYVLLMNVYIWYCYWRIPFKINRRLKTASYLVVHLLLGGVSVFYFYLYFSGRTASMASHLLSYIAGFYLTFLHYAVLMYLVHDLITLSAKVIRYPEKFRSFGTKLFFGGFVIFAISAALAGFSLFNAGRIKTQSYDVTLAKKQSELESLSVVYLADAHIGTTVTDKNIDAIVHAVNRLEPDVILIGGDMFDEGTTEKEKEVCAGALAGMQSRYGIFCVEGNHEYKSGDSDIDHQMSYFENAGITVLQDEVFRLDEKVCIAGRKDKKGHPMPLQQLLQKQDDTLPLILLDHRPSAKEASQFQAVDMQLSGHTHSGQFFPVQIVDFIVPKFTKSYMYWQHQVDGVEVVVTSGCGNWGIPSRLGSRREIVEINILFEA